MIQVSMPAFLCAICVSLYWLIVFIKVVAITAKLKKSPNVIPKEKLGLISRGIMLPLIITWILIPWNSLDSKFTQFENIAWMGASLCIVALMLTLYCWYYMGAAWRIGIDPKEKNGLIKSGPFMYVRHPIYALSMLLMLGSALVIQTKLMVLLFSIHWLLFYWEAYREEQYLEKIHGVEYQNYRQHTYRFFPLRMMKLSNARHD